MRLLLADDHILVRDVLKTYLERQEPEADIQVASTLDDALAIAAPDQPLDVIILDLKMPGMNGVEGLVRMRQHRPDVPVVIMSGSERAEDVREVMAAGARGFFPKTLTGPALLSAIRLVLAGERFVPASVLEPPSEPAAAPVSSLALEVAGDAVPLTRRELEVLRYLEKGWSNKQIARELDVHEATIKLHVRGICRKLGAKNRTQAAMKAQELKRSS